MKTRSILVVLLIGTAMVSAGSLFKALHWMGANAQILVGALLQTAMLLMLALKLAAGRISLPALER